MTIFILSKLFSCIVEGEEESAAVSCIGVSWEVVIHQCLHGQWLMYGGSHRRAAGATLFPVVETTPSKGF